MEEPRLAGLWGLDEAVAAVPVDATPVSVLYQGSRRPAWGRLAALENEVGEEPEHIDHEADRGRYVVDTGQEDVDLRVDRVDEDDLEVGVDGPWVHESSHPSLVFPNETLEGLWSPGVDHTQLVLGGVRDTRWGVVESAQAHLQNMPSLVAHDRVALVHPGAPSQLCIFHRMDTPAAQVVRGCTRLREVDGRSHLGAGIVHRPGLAFSKCPRVVAACQDT